MSRRIRSSVLAAATLAAGLSVAPAVIAQGNVSAGLTLGTLGVGPELSYRFNELLGVRANAGFFSASDSDEFDDIDYDIKLKLRSFGGNVDVYPFRGGFRLSAGLRSNGNKVDLAGRPAEAVEIGDVTYAPEQVGTLRGTIKTKKVAPTLSLGYGGRLGTGFTFGFEAGVVMQGSPRINNLRADGTLANNTEFLRQLANEQRDIEDDADGFKLWPILQLGFHYRF